MQSAQYLICFIIALPRSIDYTAYTSLINELPDQDNVVYFGLPANVERTLQKNTSQEIINQLQLLNRIESHSSGFSKDQWSSQLLPFLQIWKKLTTGNDLLQKKTVNSLNTDPIISFFDLVFYFLI